MGDRANIRIDESDGSKIYLYTHWSGTELPETLRRALERGRDRWGDETYLTRIIFSEMIQGSVLDNTGFGISTTRTDGEYAILIVDYAKQEVAVALESNESVKLRSTPFENYIGFDAEGADQFRGDLDPSEFSTWTMTVAKRTTRLIELED